MSVIARAIGADVRRIEGTDKVTGRARYAYEYDVPGALYVWPVPATIARGRVRSVDGRAALAQPGVIAVLHSENVPRLQPGDDPTVQVLQSSSVAYRGQIVAAVAAQTIEAAREAAGAVHVDYDVERHHVVLSADDPGIALPETVNAGFAGVSEIGDVEAALAAAPVAVDATYSTPAEHASPMEPHATIAQWDGDILTLYDANQGPWVTATALAALFGIPPTSVHVISDHVGGGFGSKTVPRPPTVLAALASRALERPVKVTLTRQQMFSLVTYRTPTIQRVRLGADRDGRLTAIEHDALQQSSSVVEYCEQTVAATRIMYAAPNRRTAHRLLTLDVPPPNWVRAPGEAPGMYALESAMDELAVALGMDPIELRVVNEPAEEPESGLPFSTRNLIGCLREGAERFGWAERAPAPRTRQEGQWLTGSGVAAANYPVYVAPATASARANPDGTFVVQIGAVDIGTGARTALTQVAADALGVPLELVCVDVGRSTLPTAPYAGGSLGMASWGWAVTKACRALLEKLGDAGTGVPAEGLGATADTTDDVQGQKELSRHSYGAQFAEVRVDVDTGEVLVDRLLGVYAAGRVINPRTARAQLIGAMVMGISMALYEGLEMDPAFGDFANHDLASYHVAANADIRDLEVHCLEEEDNELDPVGVKGLGELGIVGTAAAIANAVYHATGIRVRDLPITMERLRRRDG